MTKAIPKPDKKDKQPGLMSLLLVRPGKWDGWFEASVVGVIVAVCQKRRLRLVERVALSLKHYARTQHPQIQEALPYREIWTKTKRERKGFGDE